MGKNLKRVDIRLKPNRIIRGMAEIKEDGVTITYKKVDYHTPEELANALNYEVLVIGDNVFLDALNKAGYKVRAMEKRRDSLHVTIPNNVLEKLQEEAYEEGCTVSIIVEKALKKYYNM